MQFTYKSYEYMLNLLKECNYYITDYNEYENYEKCAILRYDVDNSLYDVVKLAKIEYKNNVRSTYFILLSTDFYNIFSNNSRALITELVSMGHHIGLHFDEVKYDINNEDTLKKYVQKEIDIMSQELELGINVVSMHRPSKWVLEKNIVFDNLINTYGKEYFEDFKYVSDSRMHWREDITEIIKTSNYKRLHILTHAFWYGVYNELPKNILKNFLNTKSREMYFALKSNIRNLDEFITEEEII